MIKPDSEAALLAGCVCRTFVDRDPHDRLEYLFYAYSPDCRVTGHGLFTHETWQPCPPPEELEQRPARPGYVR